MKKVTNCIDIYGTARGWEEIEREYYTHIIAPGAGRYQTPLQRLITLRREFPVGRSRFILEFLINDFEKFIKAKPARLDRIVQMFEGRDFQANIFNIVQERQTAFGERLEWAFRYEDFRSSKLVELAEILNIKSCLYCNSQYTLVVVNENRKIAKFQFDHFFPKSRFPYLSISLYNLIPSCASCNQGKSNAVYYLNNFTHPFYDDFHLLSSFSIGRQVAIRMMIGQDVPENEININLTNDVHPQVVNYEEEFSLKGIYSRHKDIIKEIFHKSYAYNNGGREALFALRDRHGNRIFNSIEEIEQLLLANYPSIEDINNRPLAKFMQDIAKEAGLIRL